MVVPNVTFFMMLAWAILAYVVAFEGRKGKIIKVIASIFAILSIVYALITPVFDLPTSSNVVHIGGAYYTIGNSAYIPLGAGTIVSNDDVLQVIGTSPLVIEVAGDNAITWTTIGYTLQSTLVYSGKTYTYAKTFYNKVPGNGDWVAVLDGFFWGAVGIIAGFVVGLFFSIREESKK